MYEQFGKVSIKLYECIDLTMNLHYNICNSVRR